MRTGLSSQWGFKEETTWGTPVVVDTFLPLISEGLGSEIERVESEGIIAGRQFLTTAQWAAGNKMVGGDIGAELYLASIRTLLKHMIGSETGSGPYTYSPANFEGLGMTVQIGVPDVGTGTVRPKTFPGCKIGSWEIACQAGQIVTCGLALLAKDEYLHRSVTDGATTITSTTLTSATAAFAAGDVGSPISGTGIPAGTTIASVTNATTVVMSAAATATATGVTVTIGVALASASYAANSTKPFVFSGATVTVGGSSVNVKQLTLAGNNNLERRFFLGSQLTSEPLQTALCEVTGALQLEYVDNTAYNRFRNGAEAALVATFASGSSSVVATLNVRTDGETPKVGGRGIVEQPLPFKAIASGADSTALQVVYTP